jgi:hypothetical protein
VDLRPGDCIERSDGARALACQSFRPTEYTWRYLRLDERLTRVAVSDSDGYESDLTEAPFFDNGWTKVDWMEPPL